MNYSLPGKGFFRINDWWSSKVALLMGMVYLFTAWFAIPFEKFLWLALLSIITISGFASFGYLLNDFFDREKDAKAGKKNFLVNKPISLVLLFFLVSLSFLLLPWKYLPFNRFSAGLILSQLALFLIYSIPPFRLKERGMAGIIVDALYAHALPVVLAAYTFSLAAGKAFDVIPITFLFAWQMISGIRNILLHQADDLFSDKKSGVKNFVASIYPNPFLKTVKYLLLLEVLLCLSLFGTLAVNQPLFVISIASILFVSFIAFVLHEKGLQQMLKGGWRFFPNNISEKWLPPSVLLALSFADVRFTAVLLLHLTIFNFNFYIRFTTGVLLPLYYAGRNIIFRLIALCRMVTSASLNRSIYYCFLLFGVDLRKENLSVFGYLKKMRNRNA